MSSSDPFISENSENSENCENCKNCYHPLKSLGSDTKKFLHGKNLDELGEKVEEFKEGLIIFNQEAEKCVQQCRNCDEDFAEEYASMLEMYIENNYAILEEEINKEAKNFFDEEARRLAEEEARRRAEEEARRLAEEEARRRAEEEEKSDEEESEEEEEKSDEEESEEEEEEARRRIEEEARRRADEVFDRLRSEADQKLIESNRYRRSIKRSIPEAASGKPISAHDIPDAGSGKLVPGTYNTQETGTYNTQETGTYDYSSSAAAAAELENWLEGEKLTKNDIFRYYLDLFIINKKDLEFLRKVLNDENRLTIEDKARMMNIARNHKRK